MMKFPFENLKVWQEGVELAKEIYRLTKEFPRMEQFGITSQLQRAGISVSLNIAEGKGRYHKKEFIQFLYNARGSLYEVITILKISFEINYISSDNYESIINKCESIQSRLAGLINSLKEADK